MMVVESQEDMVSENQNAVPSKAVAQLQLELSSSIPIATSKLILLSCRYPTDIPQPKTNREAEHQYLARSCIITFKKNIFKKTLSLISEHPAKTE